MSLTIGPAWAAQLMHEAEARLRDLPTTEAEVIAEVGHLVEAVNEETSPLVKATMDAKDEMCAAVVDMLEAQHAAQMKLLQNLK